MARRSDTAFEAERCACRRRKLSPMAVMAWVVLPRVRLHTDGETWEDMAVQTMCMSSPERANVNAQCDEMLQPYAWIDTGRLHAIACAHAVGVAPCPNRHGPGVARGLIA